MKVLVLCAFLVLGSFVPAHAEIAHYSPGLPNLRDFFLPQDTGFYISTYNSYYHAERFRDQRGNTSQLGVVERRTKEVRYIDPNIDFYTMSLPMLWTSKNLLGKFFPGVDYGFLIAPSFSNSSITDASLPTDDRKEDELSSQFGFADLYVQPLWMGAAPSMNWTWSLSWGFYAPTGKYDTQPATVAGFDFRAPSLSNIGFGFWTNQFRGAVLWSPFAKEGAVNPGPGFTLATTYEINGEKDGLHFTPGDQLTLNWGVSEYLPLYIQKGLLLELGAGGYDSWQVTSDDGNGRVNGYRDEVHAAGIELGVSQVPSLLTATLHYMYEYAAEDRLTGHTINLSLTYHFGGPADQQTWEANMAAARAASIQKDLPADGRER